MRHRCAHKKIVKLDAPVEFQADHDRLLQFLDETLGVVQAVLEAAEQLDSIQRMEELERGRVVFCSAADDFSPGFESIVDVHFDVPDPRVCAGL